MRILGCIIFTFINALLAFKYEFSFSDTLLMIIMLLLSWNFILKVKSVGNYVFELFLIIYILCSVQIVSLLDLKSQGFFKNYISFEEYKSLAIWGTQLYTIIFTIINIKFFFKRKTITISPTYNLLNPLIIERLLKKIFVIIFLLQIVTYVFGLASNYEAPRIILPFHLNGIIDAVRSNWMPFIFCIYLFDCITKSNRINKNIILYFIIYSFFEVLITNSKSIFVMNFIPLLVLITVMNKMTKKMINRIVIPLVLILVITYPIIESARQEGAISLSSLYEASQKKDNKNDEGKSSTYIRAFLTGVYYTKAYHEINNDYLSFDFSQVPLILIYGGGSGYMTRVIDKMPENVHHSSGVTGLCDALLWGGYPLCYIIVGILTIIAIFGDNNKTLCQKPLYKVILFMWFYGRVVGTTISYLIEPLILPDLVSVVVKIFLVKYYYSKLY